MSKKDVVLLPLLSPIEDYHIPSVDVDGLLYHSILCRSQDLVYECADAVDAANRLADDADDILEAVQKLRARIISTEVTAGDVEAMARHLTRMERIAKEVLNFDSVLIDALNYAEYLSEEEPDAMEAEAILALQDSAAALSHAWRAHETNCERLARLLVAMDRLLHP